MCRSPDYNYLFNLNNGYFLRWGKTEADDPEVAPGPEILDIEITTICDGGCPFCSPAGTKVSTPEGDKNIEDISAGDVVISYDIGRKAPVEARVEETYVHDYNGDLIRITSEEGRVLELTPEHPVFTNQGWVEAQDLKEGMDIICLK